MSKIRVIEHKEIEEGCSNCLYYGSDGIHCGNANNSGKAMALVSGFKPCGWYWLNQNRYERIWNGR